MSREDDGQFPVDGAPYGITLVTSGGGASETGSDI